MGTITDAHIPHLTRSPDFSVVTETDPARPTQPRGSPSRAGSPAHSPREAWGHSNSSSSSSGNSRVSPSRRPSTSGTPRQVGFMARDRGQALALRGLGNKTRRSTAKSCELQPSVNCAAIQFKLATWVVPGL